MKHSVIHKAVIVALLAFPVFAGAGVNPKNGNFYITYNDAILKKDGHELSITRTYNSMATESGWFGYGWGSLYESRLVVLPDGSAAIKENGTGRTTYYHTDNEAAIKAGVKRIVEVATRRDNLTPDAAADLATKLLGDEELRLKKVTAYGIYTELPKGAALGNVCGTASLTRVTEGYRRVDCDMFGDTARATDTFDLQGRLMRHELTDGYAVTIRYADSGTPEIRDTLGQSIALVWTPEGRVARITANKEETTYAYDHNGDLLTVADTIGHIYRHSYDDKHNMTRITYGDGLSMFISYSPRVSGRADAVTERNGDRQTFVYRTDPENAKHTWTKHTMISHTGEAASKEYEYQNETSATGVTHLTQLAQTGGNKSVETKLDSQGRVIRKADKSGNFVEFSYHPTLNKLIEARNNQRTVKYRYNAAGDPIHAEDSTGEQFELAYDGKGRVRQVTEIDRGTGVKRELSIEHDDSNRMTRLTLSGLGSIRMIYDSEGNLIDIVGAQGTGSSADPAERSQSFSLQVDSMLDKMKAIFSLSNEELRL